VILNRDPTVWWNTAAWIALAIILFSVAVMPKNIWDRVADVLFAPLDRLFDRWTGPELERVQRETDEIKSQVFPLPVEEARRLALGILANLEEHARAEAESADDPRLEQLAPLLRELFERYEFFDLSWVSFSRADIQPCEWAPGLLTIGRYDSGHEELAVRPGEETIYYVSLEQSTEENLLHLGEHSYPTIYHLLVFEDRWLQKAGEEER
jgi:hypothetical protein